MINVASAVYFVSHYRLRGDVIGTMHRMRTWYNQQARQAERDPRASKNDAARYHHASETMSSRIKEVEAFYG